MSLAESRTWCAKKGINVEWDCQKPRTREGYYRIKGGIDICIARAKHYAPYADLLWMETKAPILNDAQAFARGVRAKFPNQMLAYNLSPSFNWDGAGMSDKEIGELQAKLGEVGFCWQFITLAGFHLDALGTTRFAREFATNHMIAYVNGIQRPEAKEKVPALTHQTWSGAELIDAALHSITGGASSTQATGAHSTEHQFSKK